MKLRFGSFSTVILLGFLSVFLQYPSVQHCGIFCVLMEDWLVNPQTRGSHSGRRSERPSGGAEALWSVHWTPRREARVRDLAKTMRCVLREDTLLSQCLS